MKQIFFFLFLLGSLTAFAQNNDDADTTAKPAITEKGKPDGAKTEMKMDKDGGTLISSDGKLELIIPPGALAKKTNISIQPVTNLMPNGNGKAYSLEPAGIRFQQPAQLIFHYNSEEAEDTAQLLMGIATQDDKGQWYGLKNFILDTVAKTLTGNIPHFSTWSNFEKLKLYRPYMRLKVNKEAVFSINMIEYEDELEPLVPATEDDIVLTSVKIRYIKWNAIWSANGINNGNEIEGWITENNKTDATYKAPALVPKNDPVAVAAKLQGLTFKYKGITFKDLRLVSKVLVYDDAYEVTMISRLEGNAGSVMGKSIYKDTGSFVINVEKGEARLIEKENKNTADSLDYKGCTCRIVNKDANTGLIHITGVNSITLIPPNPPAQPYAKVRIEFLLIPMHMSPIFCKCPGNKNEEELPQFSFMPAFPRIVQFELKEGEQILNGSIDQPGMKFIMTAKPIKEE